MANESSLFQRFGKTFQKGVPIFQEGEKGDTIYIVQEGEVRLTKKVKNVERVLATVGKGEFLGEMALFNNQPRTATAVAATELKLIVLDKPTFEQMIRDNKEIGLRIIKKLVSRLEEADNRIETLMITDPTMRVVNFFQKHVKRRELDSEKKAKIDLDITIPELATFVGLAEEDLVQIIMKLKRSGVIFEKQDQLCLSSFGMLDKYIKYLDMKNQFEEPIESKTK